MLSPNIQSVVAQARHLVAGGAGGESPACAEPSLYDEVIDGLQLDRLDRDLLALTVGAAIDAEAVDALHQRFAATVLTVAVAARVLAVDSAEIALRCVIDSRLRRTGLLEAIATSAPAVGAPLLPSRRLLGLLRDRMELHPAVAEVAVLLTTDRDAALGVLVEPGLDDLAGLCGMLQAQRQARGAAAIVGEPRSGRLRVALAIAARLGRRRAIVVDAGLVAPDPVTWRALAAALISDASFHVAPVVIRDPGPAGLAAASRIAGAGLPCFVTASDEPPDGRCRLHARVVRPTETQRLAAWRHEGRGQVWLDDARLVQLARDTALSRSEIAVAAGLTSARPADGDLDGWLGLATRSQVRSQLDRFASPITRQVRLDDVVLADDVKVQLRELISSLRARPRLTEVWGHLRRTLDGKGGVAALFDGPPGTGKTLSASVVATELGVPLYRIDVATIVDRYVGETEKNLQRLFREAEACRGVLLFDEADSLFSKRVETKDAMDRFANMQVNQLLTLIEDFPGISILTTNAKQGFDAAFARRIAYKIQFELPEVDERGALWRMYLPPGQLTSDEIDRLSDRYDRVSGAEIRNAVIRAASAAIDRRRLSRDDVERSLVAELQSAGSVVSSL